MMLLQVTPCIAYEHSDYEIIKKLSKCNKKIDRNPENAKLYIQRGYFKLGMHFILTQPCRSIALCSAQKAMPLLHNI